MSKKTDDFEEDDSGGLVTIEGASSIADLQSLIMEIDGEAKVVVKITNQKQADFAGQFLNERIHKSIKRIETLLEEPIANARKPYQKLLDARKELTSRLELWKEKITVALNAWTRAQREAAEQRNAALQAKVDEANAAREAKIAALEADGDIEQAERLRDSLSSLRAVAVSTEPAKIAGVAVKQKWVGSVTDLKAFCRGIADGKVPESAVKVDQKIINAHAVSTDGNPTWPGISCQRISSINPTGKSRQDND